MYGDSGNDRLFGRDSERDSMYGGSGTDSANRDNTSLVADVVGEIESYFA